MKIFLSVLMCFFLFVTISTAQIINFPDCPGAQMDNVAYLKDAKQSSTDGSAYAEKAVDGDNTGNLANGQATLTTTDGKSFWQVDLGQPYYLESIILHYETELPGYELDDFYIFTSLDPFQSEEKSRLVPTDGLEKRYIASELPTGMQYFLNTKAQYLRIQRGSGDEVISLIEIDIPGGGEDCFNGQDDDCDGQADCDDTDCQPRIKRVDSYNPTCNICADGAISIRSFGDSYLYSIDDGVTFQSSRNFSNLLPGSYTVNILNPITGCIAEYQGNPVILAAPLGGPRGTCDNGDFESGDFTNWEGMTGRTVFDSPVDWQTTGIDGEVHNILSAVNDPFLGNLISPGTGTYIAQLGTPTPINTTVGPHRRASMLTYNFILNETNQDFGFFYAPVFQDPNHSDINQPFFQYRLYILDSDGSEIEVIAPIRIIADENDDFFETAIDEDGVIITFQTWTCAEHDLTGIVDLGEQVFVEFIAADCGAGAHYGYTYIDGLCNSRDVVAGIQSSDIECINTGVPISITSTSYNEDQWTWNICNNSNNQCITQSGFLRTPSITDLAAFFEDNGATLECDQTYTIELTVSNQCGSTSTARETIFIDCGIQVEYPNVAYCGDLDVYPIIGTNECGSNCTFSWSPPSFVDNPTIAFPNVTEFDGGLGGANMIFNHTTTDNSTGCVYTDQVTIRRFGDISLDLVRGINTDGSCEDEIVEVVISTSIASTGAFDVTLTETITGEVQEITISGIDGENSNLYTGIFEIPANTDALYEIEVRLNTDDDFVFEGEDCVLSETFSTAFTEYGRGDIPLFYFPSAFSPNAEEPDHQEFIVFSPEEEDGYNITWYRIQIWKQAAGGAGGELVYEKEEYIESFNNPFPANHIRWDGTLDGIPLNSDTYIYVLNFENCDNPRDPYTTSYTDIGHVTCPIPEGGVPPQGNPNCWVGEVHLIY